MAKLALTVVGMGIGFAIGGPFGAQIGAMIGGMVGNILFAPTVKGPRLTDLSVTASTYGQVIPRLYGTMRLGGNLIWTTGIIEKKHTSGGGKGGPKSVNYTYSASFAVAFCEGAVDGICRIWADGKLIAGSKPEVSATGEVLAMAGILNLTKNSKGKFKYKFYLGDEIQTPDSTMVAKEGEGNVPGYRGLAYLIFVDMPLEDFGNRIPQITAEITRNPVPAAPYVNFSSNTDLYPDPGAAWQDNGSSDWVNNAFYKYANTAFIYYDMRTMQELNRVTVQPGEGGVIFTDPHTLGPYTAYPDYTPAFSIGGNYCFGSTPLGNSSPANIWNATTGVCLGRIGHPSNSFPSNPHPDNTQPFYPEGALIGTGTVDGRAMWFRTLNASGQNDIVYHTGNLGSNAIMWTPGRQPVHWLDFGGGSFGGAFTWTPMRGRENAPSLETPIGNSDMLFLKSNWNGTSWDVHLKIMNIVDGAIMLHSGISAPFTTYNNPLNTETDLVIPRPFVGEDFRFTNCAYDKSDNSIVLWGDTGANNLGNFGTWRFCKYLIDEGAYKWAWKDTDLDPSLAIGGTGAYNAGISVGSPVELANQSNLDGGTIGWMRQTLLYSNPAIYVADLQTGKITLANLASPLPNYAEGAFAMNTWDDQTQSVVGAPQRIFVKVPGEGVSLQGIVDDILISTGALTPGIDWDSSALAPITVRGYVIAREATAKDILGQLAGAYFFDGVESDYIIKMKLRGGSPVGTITEKHLGFVSGRDITLKETRTQELELPMRVTVTYSDFDRDYQDGTQSSKRNTDPFPTMHSHNEVKIELPIALTATEAKQITDKSLKMAWASRWGYRMKLPWEFLKYDPTDILTVAMDDGGTYQVRLDKSDLGVDFTLNTDAISEKAAAYVSTVVGDPGSGVPVQIINVSGPCDFFMINSPLLRDIDDTQGATSAFYVSAKAKSPGDFIACYIFEATDGSGTEYEDIDVIATEPTWGIVLSALPANFGYAIDYTTVLKVRVVSMKADLTPDVLESVTYDELLAGKNAAMIGNEIVQFMTATPSADGQTYSLTGLLRARRGTNYATSGHAAGERFILLQTDGSIMKEFHDASTWQQTHSFKAVSSGTYSEDAPAVAVAMEPNDLKPYTPECVKCTDTGGANVTITFERRSRIGNELHDYDGNLPYKEGQGSLAHFVYKVYSNKLLSDKPWADLVPTIAFTGTVPIYSGVTFAPLTFQFAKAGITNFVLELYEVGFVDGFKKYIQFVNVSGTNEWDMTELY
jgi:hypothetical protein